MKRILKIGLLCLAILAVAASVFLFSASSWLETSAGRNLLQRELTGALGVQTQLQGDYSLRLLPTVHIAGSHLLLGSDPSAPLAKLTGYALRLAVRPLLSQQIDILSVSLKQGSLDLDLFTQLQQGDGNTTGVMPRIRQLEINQLEVSKAGEALAVIDKLVLAGFGPGQAADLELLVRRVLADGSPLSLSLQGTLEIAPQPLALVVQLESLVVIAPESSWPMGQGQLTYLLDEARLSGELRGTSPVGNGRYSHHIQYTVQTSPGLRVNLALAITDPDSRQALLSLVASEQGEDWLLSDVALQLADQQINGSGCLGTSGKPLLQLQLDAEVLDIDKLQSWWPAAGDSDLADPDGAAESSIDEDLPVDLAVQLDVKQATLSGGVARDARFLLGQQPACPLMSAPDM